VQSRIKIRKGGINASRIVGAGWRLPSALPSAKAFQWINFKWGNCHLPPSRTITAQVTTAIPSASFSRLCQCWLKLQLSNSFQFYKVGIFHESISSAALHRAAQHVDRWIFSWFESAQISKWSNGPRYVQRGTAQQRNRTPFSTGTCGRVLNHLWQHKRLRASKIIENTIILVFFNYWHT
jgi:hypothetical protein